MFNVYKRYRNCSWQDIFTYCTRALDLSVIKPNKNYNVDVWICHYICYVIIRTVTGFELCAKKVNFVEFKDFKKEESAQTHDLYK